MRTATLRQTTIDQQWMLARVPLLVHFKRRIASSLRSGALEAEARQTRICAYLSAILLAGLGLNAWLGWWWADPVSGLLMVGGHGAARLAREA